MSTGTSTRRTESSRGGKFCVAAGCTSTYRDNVSLHEFPREETIRRQWVNFVKAKRKDFIQPTQYSILCEKHFPPGSYPLEYEVKKSMNIPVKRKHLLPHAVPTDPYSRTSRTTGTRPVNISWYSCFSIHTSAWSCYVTTQKDENSIQEKRMCTGKKQILGIFCLS